MAGTVAFVPLAQDRDQPRSYVLVPVERTVGCGPSSPSDRRPPTDRWPGCWPAGPAPRPPEGGSSSAPTAPSCPPGRVELVGDPLIPADVLAGLPAGQSRSMVTGDGQVVVTTPIPGFLAGSGYLAYAVPADDLFSDLRAGGVTRTSRSGSWSAPP